MKSARVTLTQVAERAGVSLASTSRALHGEGASEDMVERVRVAAAELGYRPDVIGRSLRTKKTLQVAFAVADIGNPVYVEMLTAIHRVLVPAGYRVVVMSTGNTTATTIDLVHSLNSGYVDALIIAPLRIDTETIGEIARAPVTTVIIGRELTRQGIDSVTTDSAGGIGLAVDHLCGIGRRRIAFLNGPLDTTPGQVRQRGFELAMARDADEGPVGLARACDFTVAAGTAATRELLGSTCVGSPPPDAIVAANDLLAIGAIRAANELGFAVPEDIAVTGMDDIELGRVFQPSLTSVSLGTTERGEAAAHLLLDRLNGASIEPTAISVRPRLVVRQSTGGRENARSATPPAPSTLPTGSNVRRDAAR